MSEASLIEKLQACIAENESRCVDPFDATAITENAGLRKAIAIVRQHEADFIKRVQPDDETAPLTVFDTIWDFLDKHIDDPDHDLNAAAFGWIDNKYRKPPASNPVSLEKCVASMTTGVFAVLAPAWRHELARSVLRAAGVPYVE